MNAFSRNLLLLCGGAFSTLCLAAGSTYLVKYKPWGVPDVLRDQYEAKVVALDQRNQLIDSWKGKEKPKISVRSYYDVGSRLGNSQESFTFSFKNDGELPLTLEPIRASNGAAFHLAQEPLMPGEEGIATVQWTSKNNPGPFEFNASFRSSDPLQESFTINFGGRIKAKVLVPQTVAMATSNAGETTQGTLVVRSETWDSIDVIDIQCDDHSFDWNADRIDHLGDDTSAVEVTLLASFFEHGKSEKTLTVTTQGPTGERISSDITIKVKVRQPISFQGPELHISDGLDIGTIESGPEQAFYVNCKVHGDNDRTIEVLDIKPEPLRAELKKQSVAGNYRLSVIIPKDCPMVVFNTNQQGYIKVGDPEDERFSNWLPIHGVVVPQTP
ncbi:MAG: DUF1573 domain-containing protein [Rubripirellula sp.]|nr:DUF1573 domain-containing protein [Rubripirellula sp.]